MKRLITILTLFFFLALTVQVKAQKYTCPLGNSPTNTIKLTTMGADVVIEGYEGDTVIVRNLDYEPLPKRSDAPPPEKAEGLKLLTGIGKVNTKIGIHVRAENNVLHIIAPSRNGGDYRLRVPDEVRVVLENTAFNGTLKMQNLKGEIEIDWPGSDIILENVTGPIVASSISGNIEITVSELSQKGPTSISVVSGYIDLTLPADAQADLILGTISGEIYTNMNINRIGEDDSDLSMIGGRTIRGTINGGGVKVELKTISGTIYVRKK